MHVLRSSIVVLTAFANSLSLAASLVPQGGTFSYCTFYTDVYCDNRSGSVSYELDNPHTFQNAGPYMRCDGWFDNDGTVLQSFGAEDPDGLHEPKYCWTWWLVHPPRECISLPRLGFTTGDGGYYRFRRSANWRYEGEGCDAAE